MELKGNFGVKTLASKREETIVHQLPSHGQFRGAISIMAIMTCLIVGPLMPLVLMFLLAKGFFQTAVTVVAIIVGSHIMAGHSPRWCRFYLDAAGFFKQGVFLHIEKRSIKALTEKPSMVCTRAHYALKCSAFTRRAVYLSRPITHALATLRGVVVHAPARHVDRLRILT